MSLGGRPGRGTAPSGVLVCWIGLAGCGPGADSGEPPSTRVAPPPEMFGVDPLIYDVRDVVGDGEGGIWLLNGGEPYINHYDGAGETIARFGLEGDGPEELRNPQQMAWGAGIDGSPVLWVWDVGRSRLVSFDPQGVFETAVSTADARGGVVRGDILGVTYADPFAMDLWDDGFIVSRYPRGVSRTGDQAFVDILWLSGTESSIRVLRSLSPIGDAPPAPEFSPVPLWATCGADADSRLFIYRNDVDSLLVHAVDERSSRTISVGLPRAQTTDADIIAYLSHVLALEIGDADAAGIDVGEMVGEMLASVRQDFAVRGPRATRLICDDEGRLWFELFDTSADPRGRGRDWAVFGLDQQQIEDVVRFPAAFELAFVASGVAVGIHADTLGLQQLARIETGSRSDPR